MAQLTRPMVGGEASLVRRINRSWKTPLTDVAPHAVGNARLVRKHYRGVYNAEGVGGHEFYKTTGWMPVTALQRRMRDPGRRPRWKTWMVDDPVHWDGMREAVADLPSGRILVAGLGLGLFLHHMAADPRFTSIDVVEIDPDVIALIRPTVPADPRVRIWNDDFYQFVWNDGNGRPGQFDGVLWDLAVGTPNETRGDILKGRGMVALCVDAPLVQFGLRRTPRDDKAIVDAMAEAFR